MKNFVCLVIGLVLINGVSAKVQRPSIIFILTDDQDVLLGGLEPMDFTNKFLSKQGATFTNAFVSTPVCCPSRSSILTGKYPHNTHVINNTVTGNCSSHFWRQGPEQKTIATYLHNQGYRTFYGGKYLNQYGKPENGGVSYVPPGWDRWVGLVGNSRYYNYTLSVNGQEEKHGDNYEEDYLTDLLTREALDFLESHTDRPEPFFMMISPPACHSPFTPAPQHSRKFANRTAPRLPNFNRPPGGDKHWIVRQKPRGPLPDPVIQVVDEVFRNRWRTLLSVDEMVSALYKSLQQNRLLESTYFLYTSDHGYHLGQFTLPVDKRQPYETDIRVPLLVRGPGIDSSTIINQPVVSIDLAPTILDLAGIEIPDDMDGTSLVPLMIPEESYQRIWDSYSLIPSIDWRSSFLIEYHGEADESDIDPACPMDPGTTLCYREYDCKCQDSSNNTYFCSRVLSRLENSIFCQFNDLDGFTEYYDLRADPYQLHNKAFQKPISRKMKESYKKIQRLRNCRGLDCLM